jgi:chromosome segregation ATPase
MADKLFEIPDVPTVDEIKHERETVLSEVARMTQRLSDVLTNPKHQKNEDYRALESGLAQLKAQYVQTTDTLIANTDVLAEMQQENAQLKEANKTLANEAAADTQLFDKTQQERTSRLTCLAEEKAKLSASVKELEAAIAAEQAESDRLDSELEQLKQDSETGAEVVESQNLMDTILREKAEIADLFLELRARKASVIVPRAEVEEE